MSHTEANRLFPSADRARILLVEDDSGNALVLATIISGLGYEFDSVESGELAVQCAVGYQYAVILMDIRLGGISGLEASQRIWQSEHQANKPRTPVILISASAPGDVGEAFQIEEYEGYLQKPHRAEELENILAAYTSIHCVR